LTTNHQYHWPQLLGISLSVTVAFGALLYALSVLLTDEAAGSVFSTTTLSAAYGGSVLVGGGSTFWIGRYADRNGIRAIVFTGAIVGGLGLWGFGISEEPWQVIAVSWLVIGPASALLFYEPAYIAVNQWFGAKDRGRAISILTVFGGLAGPVFLPLTGWLVDEYGWRTTSKVLAVIVFVVGAGVSQIFLPEHEGHRDQRQRGVGDTLRRLVGDRRFVWFTAATFLMFGALQAVFFHRIAVFEEGGFSIGKVTAWAALAGVLSFPGRWGASYLARRFGGVRVNATVLLAQAVAVALTVNAVNTWQLGGHFILFGLLLGMLLPLRAVIMSDWYAGSEFGSIMGAQWSVTALAGAGGATVVGALRDTLDGYAIPMAFVAATFVAAAVATVVAGRIAPAARTEA
jgi:predicted MFS family arabinose efflux permease